MRTPAPQRTVSTVPSPWKGQQDKAGQLSNAYWGLFKSCTYTFRGWTSTEPFLIDEGMRTNDESETAKRREKSTVTANEDTLLKR